MRTPRVAVCSRLLAFILVCVLLVSVAAPGVIAAPPERVRVLISFAERPGAAEDALVRGVGGNIRYTYRYVNAIAAEVPEAALTGLSANPHVRLVEPDLVMYALDDELTNSWGVVRIGAGQVHITLNKGEGVRVAIIDSGVNYNHPDLDGNYVGGWDFIQDDGDPMDVYGHGTHVAGTVCAEDNDNGALSGPYGVVGVAPKCALYALRVLDDAGYGYASDLIAAMEWAIANHIQVANLSLGWDRDPGSLVAQAFANAEQAGMVVVAAAGNNGTRSGKGENVSWPARYASVIAVAATDNTGMRAIFSSTGTKVELAAPGVSVFSTWNDSTSPLSPQPVCRTTNGITECYKYGSGTSMASPHVAGAAALVIAAGIVDTNGNYRINDEVRQRLIDTADDLGAAGRDPQYGYGLVNAYAAANFTPPSTYNVSGTVIDAVGAQSIQGAKVSIAGLSATTDGIGGYTIAGVAVGGYNMTVSAEGYQSQTRAVDVIGDTEVNWALTAQPVQTMGAADITFAYVRRGTRIDLQITVTIQDGVDAPVPGASVNMTLVRSTSTLSFSGVTGANGQVVFTAKKLPTGTYIATVTSVSCSGYVWDGNAISESYIVLP